LEIDYYGDSQCSDRKQWATGNINLTEKLLHASTMSSLAYEEPDHNTLLAQSSFLLLLNIADYILNRALYCGLLGQVLLGVAFGTPGGDFLSLHAQQVIGQLGYIGLILLVFHGGLCVSLTALKANLGLSVCVALTGIAVPIGLSFVLQPLLNATPLQAFAAGASLCSTSLGTTFTVLSASGLARTRLGAVLSTAAMMDDVVGLVMVQVISNLGSSTNSLEPVDVLRPILVSIGFAVVVPLACRYVVRPIRRVTSGKGDESMVRLHLNSSPARFLMQAIFLFGLVVAASYSGTSPLFAAYLAGAVMNWWDHQPAETPAAISAPLPLETSDDTTHQSNEISESPAAEPERVTVQASLSTDQNVSSEEIYEAYLQQPVDKLLKPFFFVGYMPFQCLIKADKYRQALAFQFPLQTSSKVPCFGEDWCIHFSWSLGN
jgi:Kef-type K+ transport system membrane component KefB